VDIGGNTFSITQPGTTCVTGVTPTAISAQPSGTSSIVTVGAPTGCAWTAVSNASWITVTAGSSGTGGGTFSYTVAANPSTTARTGTVSVGGNTFTVNQGGATCSPTFSSSSTSVPSTAGSGTITVTAATGCSWTATTNATWITITNGSTGSGNGTVDYSLAANTGTLARTGSISVGTSSFSITQAGVPCSFTIWPPTLVMSAIGGTSSVNVTTGLGCSWTATSGASWVTISNGTGRSGSGTVGFTAAANTTSLVRSATLTIAGQTFVVTEPSASCTFSVAPVLVTVPAGGATMTITVTTQSGCAWMSSTNAAWITLTATGTGSGTGSFTLPANPGTLSRSGSISVAGVQITVIQAGSTSPAPSPDKSAPKAPANLRIIIKK